MAAAAPEPFYMPEESGLSRAVAALERLWIAVRNYGTEHAASLEGAATVIVVLHDVGGGEVMTLRVAHGCFVEATNPSAVVPSTLADRLYGTDVAAISIAAHVKTDELIHFVNEIGCPSLDEARLHIDALIAGDALDAITVLRMRFDSLSATVGHGHSGAWDQLAAQLLNPEASNFDAQAFGDAIERACQGTASHGSEVRDVLSHIAARARTEEGADASASVGRLRSVLESLRPETREQLTTLSSTVATEELDQLTEFVDVLPLQDGIECLKRIDSAAGAPAAAGVRMVQRLSRVAAHNQGAMHDLAEISKRWAKDASVQDDPHAEALNQVSRIMHAIDEGEFNPEEYDERLASIAAGIEQQDDNTATLDEAFENTLDHVMLGLELLESPEMWLVDRMPVMHELDMIFAGDEIWESLDGFLCFVERLAQIRTTAQSAEARTEANAMLERLLAAPNALREFSNAGAVPEVARMLALISSAGVPAAIDLLARLSAQSIDRETRRVIESCIDRFDPITIRDRIAHELESAGDILALRLALVPRVRAKDAQTILKACVTHRATDVRTAAMRMACECIDEVPIEWMHSGLRDSEKEVRRATVKLLADLDTDMAVELLTLHILGELASSALDRREIIETIDAIGSSKNNARNRCLASIVGRAFVNPQLLRTGAPELATNKLRPLCKSVRHRLMLMMWSIWPARLIFRIKRDQSGSSR